MNKIKVLFVCMGNICRSPTAEGVFNKLLQDEQALDLFEIDSAGTHAYHIGESPDDRAQETARKRGIDLSYIRGRKFDVSDFEDFDYILAMDTSNYKILMQACPPHLQHKVKRFLDYAPQRKERDVPDPYYGGDNGFEHVFDLVADASRGFYDDIRPKDTASA